MFKLIILVFMVCIAFYYIDVVFKAMNDTVNGLYRYKLGKALIPFAYWISPVKDSKKKSTRKKSSVKS